MAQNQATYERLEEASSTANARPGNQNAQHPASTAPTAANQQRVVKRRERHKGKLYGLGITECVLGVAMIILAIATLAITGSRYTRYSRYYYHIGAELTYSSQGLWSGVLVTVTGILGVCANKNPSVCMYNANMAMSIISAFLLAPAIILSGIAAPFSYTAALAIHILIAILGFAAMVICIVHSAFCCAGVCCHKSQNRGVVVYVPQQAQQLVRLPNGQVVMAAPNPVMPQQYAYGMAASAPISNPTGYQSPPGVVVAGQTGVNPQGAAVLQPSVIASHNPQGAMLAYQTVAPPQAPVAQPSVSAPPHTGSQSITPGAQSHSEGVANPPSYATLPPKT